MEYPLDRYKCNRYECSLARTSVTGRTLTEIGLHNWGEIEHMRSKMFRQMDAPARRRDTAVTNCNCSIPSDGRSTRLMPASILSYPFSFLILSCTSFKFLILSCTSFLSFRVLVFLSFRVLV